MRCAKCKSDNPTGNKFCAQCGGRLAPVCPRCHTESPVGANFCGTCGAELNHTATPPATPVDATPKVGLVADVADSAPAIDGERKTVTALFADIQGSTALEERLDPEEAREIIDPALSLMIRAARHFDGYVVQSTGDGIFALFGAPLAHEDHPQRALYAALRIQDELMRYSAKLREAGNPPIEARIGVNTGEVVVRSIATGVHQTEYTPIGHTANLASRMQTVAPTGSIAATDTTRRLCEGYFSFRALGPTRVKGLSAPVDVHEVTGLGPLRTRIQRSAGRGLSRFVGREREITEMRSALALVRQGHGQIVAAMGEPGLGKSRLFFEFKATSQAGCLVLETFSVSYGKASTYAPLIELLNNYFDLEPADDSRKRREKVTGKVIALDRALEDTLPYFFGLLGMDEMESARAGMEPQVLQRRTFEAIKRLLLRESLNQPVILIFEDLHWIDEETQASLNLIADSIATARILLLVNYRPEYVHSWGNRTYYTQLRLDPLGTESSADLLRALLGDSAELEPVRRMIVERSEGNPFFIEELVQSLFDEQVLRRNGAVTIARPLSAVRLPPTVQGVLAARIDRLPPPAKELLQMLAVVGRKFPLGLVRKLAGRPDHDLDAMLSNLQSAEFIYEQPTVADLEYTFKHALTREIAYGTLLGERRKLMHQRIAFEIEQNFPALAEAEPEQLAHHYSQAGMPGPASIWRERASDRAAARSAYPEAIEQLRAGLEETDRMTTGSERDRRHLGLLLKLGPALWVTKGSQEKEVEEVYQRARRIGEALGDVTGVFKAAWGLWLSANLDQTEAARAQAEELVALGARSDDDGLLLEALHCRWSTAFFRGETSSTINGASEGARRYDRARHGRLGAMFGGHDPSVCAHATSSIAFCVAGRLEQAKASANQALQLAEELEHSPTLAFALADGAMAYQIARDYGATYRLAQRAIEITDRYSLFAPQRTLGLLVSFWVQSCVPELARGAARVEPELIRAAAFKALRFYYSSLLAEVRLRTGRVDEALTILEHALEAVREPGVGFYLSEIHRLRGDCLMLLDPARRDEALHAFEMALEIATRQEAHLLRLRATVSRLHVMAAAGRPEAGVAALRKVFSMFTEGFDSADLVEARTLLDRFDA
jgi:class 3 adenylate cyclase/tetratricopeptide (TPR) repeat protein